MRAGSPRGRTALACAALALAWAARPASAEIEARQVEGDLVFTSRPERKPGPEETGAAAMPRGARRGGPAPARLVPLVEEVSRRHGLDPRLVATVIGVESGFDEGAVSPKGARGLMQLMPVTAREYGVKDVHDARDNLEGGVAYLKDLARRYDGDLKLALAAYNAGPEAVEQAGGVPNFRETREYLRKIEARYGRDLSRAAGKGSGGSVRAMLTPDGTVLFTNRDAPRVTAIRRSSHAGS